MMDKKVSNRDWINLSAYVDGQLSARQNARLEARLQDEPELQRVYRGILRNRQAMRALPRVRAPRNFTLTPQMVALPQRTVFRWPQAMAMTSALASLLLVLVVLSDFFIFQAAGGNLLAAQPEVAAEVEMLAEEMVAGELPLPREAPLQEGLLVEEAPEMLAEEEQLEMPAAAPPEESLTYPAPEALTIDTPSASDEPEIALDVAVEAQPETDMQADLPLSAPEEELKNFEPAGADLQEATRPRVTLWVGTVLAVFVLATGVGAYYLHQRGW